MANLPKPIEIELDKPRKMYITLGAMYEFEQATGKSMEEMDESMNDILEFLCATLKYEDPDVEIRDFMHFIHPGNMEDIMEKLNEAMAEISGSPSSQQQNNQSKNNKRSIG